MDPMARTRTIPDEALLAAARMVFLRAGVSGSTKEIAERAGVSEATLFKRFGTKAELFFRAMVPEAADAARAVGRCGGAVTGAAFVACCMREMMAYFRMAMPSMLAMLAHPDFESRGFGVRHPDNPARQFAAAIAGALAERLDPAATSPGERDKALHAAAALMVTSIHSLAQFELMALHETSPADIDDLIDQMAGLLWSGTARRLTDGDS
jgi:AcrR family transcriptional regulator